MIDGSANMATPLRHPSDATLLAYAAGSLGEGLSLVIACHLTFCPACRDAVAKGEAIGGGLLEDMTPGAMSERARERILARLDERVSKPQNSAPEKRRAENPRAAYLDPDIPTPLFSYMGDPEAPLPWRSLAPGIRQIILRPPDAAGRNLRLLRVNPGSAIQRHGHNGTELALVLAGAFVDEIGRLGRGDLMEADDHTVHRPTVDGSDPCVCLIATEGLLVLETLLARIIQRFTRF